jgi:class 3 adenylate cyclase/tetratricopeptide (TPR) repeat protein
MNCACGHARPERAKFCPECGAAFAPRCASCGAELTPAAKFCAECGADIRSLAPPTPVSARKVVTILFADLAGSTALHERLDPESVNAFMESYYQAMRRAVEAHRGTVVKFLGDGVMAAFGVPRVAEDDALRAVRAAVAMQQAFDDLARHASAAVGEIGLRVALNTGEVVVNADNTDVLGDPVNVAARLQQEARNGDVVLGESTHRLVATLVTLAPLGSVTLKGRAEKVTAYRVESLERPAGAATVAFVGRDEELGRITAVYDTAVTTPAARLAVLLGSPGLGKSRMIDEFTSRLGDRASVITAQCDAAGGATFAPVAEALREFLRREDGSGSAVGAFELARHPGMNSRAESLESPLKGTPDSPSAVGFSGLGTTEPGNSFPGDALLTALAGAMPASDSERTRIINGITALLAGFPASPEETFFIIRRFLAALAGTRPVVLVIDDLQWAEPLLLDFVEHLVQWGSGVPLLVLVGARPELRDLRSSLVTPGGFVADVVTLGGLDAGAAMRLAANVIGADDLPAAVAAKVLATSEGNPLFVAELVRMLVDKGAIQRQRERWIIGANLKSLEMPPTIHALLAARIERLRPEDRTVLERAAVVGRHFSRSAVAALLGRNGSELDARLEALRRTELIERDTGWFLGEPMLRFHHVLIRDAAYRCLLKGTRAELHEHLADWIEAQVKDAPEHDETIGWHLEQAHQHRRELGPLDAQGKTLGERAASRLAAAGRRALARDDLPVAAGLLGRAIDRLDSDDPARADLALDWCEALLAAGDVGTAAKAIEELGRFINAPSDAVAAPSPGVLPRADVLPPLQGSGFEQLNAEGQQPQRGGQPIARGNAPGVGEQPSDGGSNRLRAWHTCFTGQLTVLTAPQALHTTADAVAAAADALATLGDAAGEAKGHFVHALALARLGKVGGCEAALDRALAAARRAGDRRRANTVLAIAPLAALWGPSPVTRASGRCLDVVRVLRITQGAPAVEAVALSCQAVLEALRGRTDAARRMLAAARKMVEDLGITQRLLETDVFGGLIDLLEGDAVAAEHSLRRAYDGLRDLGLGIDAARAAALLARALLAQDRGAEAEALSHESEALAGDDLKAAIAWRVVRAEALAQRGDHAAAVELAQAAVGIASATDALLDHADARLALAAALRAAGRGHDADAEERRAIELWEAKGATLLVERARQRVTTEPEKDRPPLPRGDSRGVDSTIQPPPSPLLGKEGEVCRRVRPNEVTTFWARFDAVFAARDTDAIDASFNDAFAETDHTTGASYGRDGALASIHRLLRSPDPGFRHEALATLGPSLGLVRGLISASGTGGGRFDVAAYEIEEIKVTEVDAQGQLRSAEVFARERLTEAITRLYERYAEILPEGPERDRAAATARTMGSVLRSATLDGWCDSVADDFELVDHRVLGIGSLRGGEAMRANFRAMFELEDIFEVSIDDVTALRSNAILVRGGNSGVIRSSGGAYERRFLQLWSTGSDGRFDRFEYFDADKEAEALARFDELVAGVEPQPAVRRRVTPNAGSAAMVRIDAALAGGDFDTFAAEIGPDFEEISPPTGATYGREAMLRSVERFLRLPGATARHELLATLGDRLWLLRRWMGASAAGRTSFDVGDYEKEEVGVNEVDEHGMALRNEIFATDRLGDALVRLYERFAELLPEGGQRARAAAIARSLGAWNGRLDLDRFRAAFDPLYQNVDHRVFGTWSTGDAAETLRHYRLQLDLAPDFAGRYDEVFAANARALVARMTFFGTARDSGGPFENQLCTLIRFGADGRMTHTEVFEAEQVVEALARFDELIGRGTDSVADWFENAAGRADRELFCRFNARDWPGVEALAAPELVFDERRRMLHNTCGREVWLEQFRVLFDVPKSRFTTFLRATRGDRLSLHLHCFEGEVAEGGGPLEMDDHLVLHEVDGAGRIVAIVLFDLEDADAAYAELDARWTAGEALAHPLASKWLADYLRFFAARDWNAMATLFAPELVGENHRLVGWGTLHGPGAIVSTLQAQIELAPDTQERIDHVRTCDGAVLFEYAWHGTREGGAFENVWVVLVELARNGRARRADVWEPEQLEQARARFDAIAGRTPDPLRIPPNAATRAYDRWYEAAKAGNWDALDALYGASYVFDDRRRLFRETHGREGGVINTRFLFEGGWRPVRTLLATAGDRLALQRIVWTTSEAGAVSEIEVLELSELDGEGRFVRVVLFDPSDRAAASAELFERYAANGADGASAAILDVVRAWNDHDPERLRALLPDDFYLDDRRRTGVGRITGVDAYLASLTAIWELSSDLRLEMLYTVATAEHLILYVCQWFGTNAEGGDFDAVYACLGLARGGRPAGLEIFELDELGAAQARFAELSAVSAT